MPKPPVTFVVPCSVNDQPWPKSCRLKFNQDAAHYVTGEPKIVMTDVSAELASLCVPGRLYRVTFEEVPPPDDAGGGATGSETQTLDAGDIGDLGDVIAT